MYSLHIPSDLNYMINKISKISTNELTTIVNLTVKCVQEHNYQNINLQTITTKLSLSIQETEDLFGILLILIRWCQRLRTQSDREIKNEFSEQGFTGEWANNFLNLIMNKADICTNNKYILQINKLNWRIDISLYNNAFKRTMPPVIIWNITLSDGKQIAIEISIKKFHEIRFNISTLLKEINIVKNNSLIKK